MTSKGRRGPRERGPVRGPFEDPFAPVALGAPDNVEDVLLLRTLDGAAVVLPVSMRRLREDELDLVVDLQGTVRQIQRSQALLEEQVRHARDHGLSWNVIGWCVGTTGEAARQRWGGVG